MATYTHNENHAVSFYINNLTDANYYEKRGYNMPGRSIGIRYNLNIN
ncbi:MAG: hypothetical protein ABEH43_05495 [Flavobacteriales bacterium]